jgi:hypothetical protein
MGEKVVQSYSISGTNARKKISLTGYTHYTLSQFACDTCQNAQGTSRSQGSSRLRLFRLSKFRNSLDPNNLALYILFQAKAVPLIKVPK